MDSRYITSVSILHSLVVAHLEELRLGDVSKSLKEQHPIIMKLEKEERQGENDLIETAVINFFEDCKNVELGSSQLVRRFHEFMEMMIRAHRLEYDLQDKFEAKVARVKVELLRGCSSIQDLSSFVQGVTYANVEGGTDEEE